MERQRVFLSGLIEPLQLAYRRVKTAGEARNRNCAFSFLKNGKKIKICKTFMINTLGITERSVRAVTEAKSRGIGIVPQDGRGKHSHHLKTDEEVLESVRSYINSIPRVESYYLRAQTSRKFIERGLTVAEMHRNYKAQRDAANKTPACYDTYFLIFNAEFNIGFFIPKKDQCDECEAYKNATGTDKDNLEARHQLR